MMCFFYGGFVWVHVDENFSETEHIIFNKVVIFIFKKTWLHVDKALVFSM